MHITISTLYNLSTGTQAVIVEGVDKKGQPLRLSMEAETVVMIYGTYERISLRYGDEAPHMLLTITQAMQYVGDTVQEFTGHAMPYSLQRVLDRALSELVRPTPEPDEAPLEFDDIPF